MTAKHSPGMDAEEMVADMKAMLRWFVSVEEARVQLKCETGSRLLNDARALLARADGQVDET